MMRWKRIVGSLQRGLEALYAVSSPHRVEAFVQPGAGETLLVRQDEDCLEVALRLDVAGVTPLVPLGRLAPYRLFDRLSEVSLALEGVSHFLYLVLRAQRGGQISQLELEVQAEVDKFALGLWVLWRHGQQDRAGELRERLMERVGYRDGLEPEAHRRYEEANRLARSYALRLEKRFILDRNAEGLLRELRRMYRLGAEEKLAHLSAGP